MGTLQDCNLMYSSPRRALFVHNKSATGRSRGDSGGLGGWTGAKVEGHATRGRSNLPEGIRAEGAAHARADSGVLGGRNARAREVLRFSRGRNAPALRVCRRFLAEGPSLRYAGTVGMPLASKRKGERLDAHESPLLTDQRVRGRIPRSARGPGRADQPGFARARVARAGAGPTARRNTRGSGTRRGPGKPGQRLVTGLAPEAPPRERRGPPSALRGALRDAV
jgi:hypothetical protein